MHKCWGPQDIVAIKNVSPGDSEFVYLGALSPAATVTPGVWSRRVDIELPWAAQSRDGRVGDFLAVSSPNAINLAPELQGKLVAIAQNGRRFTHLAVVRSAESLAVADPEPGSPYVHFVWLEVIAMAPNGFKVDVPSVKPGKLPFYKKGGNFVRIDETKALSSSKDRIHLRREIWLGFGPIAAPGDAIDAKRPARRP